jgi:hypothetical protein
MEYLESARLNATAPSSMTIAARAERRKSEIIWLSDSGVITSIFRLPRRNISDLWPAGLFGFDRDRRASGS